MGIATVAVYSECDRAALHVRYADEAYAIGPSPPRDSYLRIDRMLDAAARAGADAVHPGYGFLAENEEFAAAVRDAGLTFIGPTPEAMTLMGSKTAARATATRAGVTVVPGTDAALADSVSDEEMARAAETIGYPLLVKAVAGGGGKGMRTVVDRAELARRFARPGPKPAPRSAIPPSISSDGSRGRGTSRCNFSAITTATCCRSWSANVRFNGGIRRSSRRRPSPAVTPAIRHAITAAAASVARAAGYTNAGTIEFLLDEDGRFYFLEMNTRLQVEHPITEMVTGVDLVRWQIRIARGERLDLDPERLLTPNGHAIECRIYAEDPDNNFLPSPGRIVDLRAPAGPGTRDDSGIAAGLDVPIFYDPLISKLVAWAEDRPQRGRSHAPRAWRVCRHRHQDHGPVLPVASRSARIRFGPVSHDVPRSGDGGACRAAIYPSG